jgi:hypothetical protein
MDSAKLNDWMQIIGLFAVVASLIFLALQMRQDRELAVVDSASIRAAAVAELADVITDNRELWVSGLYGDELSPSDLAAFHAMIESVESYYYALSVRVRGNASELMPAASGNSESTYAYALYSHQGLRRAWEQQMEHVRARDIAANTIDPGTAFRERVNAKLDELDDDSPQLPANKRYVFW